jgi:beta-lactam-binding protein with PASTA domain
MLTDDAVREELQEAAEAVPPVPPSTTEVLRAGRRRGRRGLFIVAALAVAAVAAAIPLAGVALFGATKVRPLNIPFVAQPTTVPDVVGLSLRQARKNLGDAGLLVNARGGCDEQDARCRVVAQTPAGRATVEDGTRVDLRVAARARRIRVPAVEGMPAAAAKAKLVGYTIRDDGGCDANAQTCLVVKQHPTAGTLVSPKSAVRLELDEAAPERFPVPAVIGKQPAAAERALRDRGLTPSSRGECPDAASCRITTQEPAPPARVASGDVVIITRASGRIVVVPDVVGQEEVAAITALADAGLSPPKPRCKAETGCTIRRQIPAAGTEVVQGTEVRLSLKSKTAGDVELPDVVGEGLAAARAKLEALGLKTRTECAGATCDEFVEAQTPKPGTQVGRDSEVTLTLRPPKKVIVPDLAGKSATEARSALVDRRLTPRVAGSGSEVIKQSVKAGAEVDPQTTVTVTLGDPTSDPDPSATP